MGHIVNPVSFRLGVTKFWKSTTVSLYDSFFKDICSYERNCTEFIEWFYKAHYLKRKSPFVLKSIFRVKRRERRLSLFFSQEFTSCLKDFWLQQYIQYYLHLYLQILYDCLYLKCKQNSYGMSFNKNVFNFAIVGNESLNLDRILQDSKTLSDYLVLKDVDFDNGFEKFLQKEQELITFLENISSQASLTGDYNTFFSLLMGVEFSDINYSKIWLYRTFFKADGIFSKVALILDTLRYLTKIDFSEENSQSQSYSLLRMLSTPELSHFVVYRSGHYSTKVLLYLSHPLLRTLVKSFDDDWSLVIGFTDEFYYFIDYIQTELKFFNQIKREIGILVILLVYFYKKFYKTAFFKDCFENLYHMFLHIMREERSLNLSIVDFLAESEEDELCLFSSYNILKRSMFYFSLRVSDAQRYNGWFQKNISNVLAYEYERLWLNLLQKRFSQMLRPNQLVFKVYFIEARVITTRLLFNYFCRHLRQRKPVNAILGMILNELKRQKALIGFKILTAGRFTRRERALYKWQVFQRTPLSLYGSYLDFFCGVYKSRFGVCSFKFWFFKE